MITFILSGVLMSVLLNDFDSAYHYRMAQGVVKKNIVRTFRLA